MFLGRYKELIENSLTRLEECIKNLVSERGASERLHQAEIARLENQHLRETEALKSQINYLVQMNERLLRLSGLDPIPETRQEEKVSTEQFKQSPATISGGIIARDRNKTDNYRAYLEDQAQKIKLSNNNGQSDLTS